MDLVEDLTLAGMNGNRPVPADKQPRNGVILVPLAEPAVVLRVYARTRPGSSLGITTGLVTIGFLDTIERIPLGTAVAIECLGPLTVAA